MIKGILASLLVLQLAFAQEDSNILNDYPIVIEKPCYIGGCNGEICSPYPIEHLDLASIDGVKVESEDNLYRTCIYRPAHKCLGYARCERQSHGGCEFTVTVGYAECLFETFNDYTQVYDLPLNP